MCYEAAARIVKRKPCLVILWNNSANDFVLISFCCCCRFSIKSSGRIQMNWFELRYTILRVCLT